MRWKGLLKEVAEQKEMKIHPYAQILPPMSDKEFDALVHDIKRSGLQEEIVTLKGEILDG